MDGCEFPECYCGDKPCSVMREKILEKIRQVLDEEAHAEQAAARAALEMSGGVL